MRIVIDNELCSGCGLCISFCPEGFGVDQSGKAMSLHWEIPLRIETECKTATEICPRGAIQITR